MDFQEKINLPLPNNVRLVEANEKMTTNYTTMQSWGGLHAGLGSAFTLSNYAKIHYPSAKLLDYGLAQGRLHILIAEGDYPEEYLSEALKEVKEKIPDPIELPTANVEVPGTFPMSEPIYEIPTTNAVDSAQ